MNITKTAFTAGLASALLTGMAWADQLAQPHSLTSTASFNYYAQDEASPSDIAVPPPAPHSETAPAPAASNEAASYSAVAASGSCCDSGCDSNGCSSCNTGCDSCGNGCDSGCDSCGCCSTSCGLGLSDLLPDCCLGEPWKLWDRPCSNVDIGGHFQVGYHNKPTPLSAAYGDLAAFNDVPDNVNVQQAWLYMERAAQGDCCGWDWGYRADLVYGTDAQKTQAFGGTDFDNSWDHGVYGWAMPQLYAELDRGDLNIKMGHFFTPVGYEVVPATGNFFYSHSLTMFNSEPFTHTGVLATYEASCDLTVYAGWTLGWDTGFEANGNGNTFIGGFSYDVSEDIGLTYIATVGDLGARGGDAYSHSIVADVTLTDNLSYVFQSDYVRVDETQDDDVGINQYLFYTVSDCTAVGARFEWWKNEGQSNYETTLGLNYKPHANVVLRPEIRHDFTPATNFDQTTLGVDAILTF